MKHLPNSITLFNLFCGCVALINVLDGAFLPAFWWLFAAGWADYADGLVARLLGIDSPMGKELDSLADMVSFGVVPGAIFYKLLAFYFGDASGQAVVYPAMFGFVLPVFSCLRLAKFNLDPRQTEGFIGLPTPSSTIFTVGLMLMYHFDSFGWRSVVGHPYFLVPTILILSYLLVAELPMFSFKFKRFAWKGNEIRFIFVGMALLSLLFLREAAFSFIILLYVLIALGQLLFSKK